MQDPVPGPLTPPPSQPSCCVLNAQARTAHSLAPDPARGSQVPGGDISWAFTPMTGLSVRVPLTSSPCSAKGQQQGDVSSKHQHQRTQPIVCLAVRHVRVQHQAPALSSWISLGKPASLPDLISSFFCTMIVGDQRLVHNKRAACGPYCCSFCCVC